MFGADRVVRLDKDPGLDFYRASEQRPGLLPGLAKTLADACPEPQLIAAQDISWKVSLTPYRAGDRLFVDINNTDLDLAADTLTPTAPLHFTVNVPPALRGAKWKARVPAPGEAPTVNVKLTDAGLLDISTGPVSIFASVVIEKQ